MLSLPDTFFTIVSTSTSLKLTFDTGIFKLQFFILNPVFHESSVGMYLRAEKEILSRPVCDACELGHTLMEEGDGAHILQT